MAKAKGTSKPQTQTFKLQGHSILLRQPETGAEQLWIDGRRLRVLKSRDGYNLEGDVYQRPAGSLMEAIKDYVKRMPAAE